MQVQVGISYRIKRNGYVRVTLHWRSAFETTECSVCFEGTDTYLVLHGSCILCLSCKAKLVPLGADRCFKCLRFLTDDEYTFINGRRRVSPPLVTAKECPGCGIMIERIGGCDHMECPCGQHFDWTTLELLDDEWMPFHDWL